MTYNIYVCLYSENKVDYRGAAAPNKDKSSMGAAKS